MDKLVPPCAYQGGKSKVASQIVNYIINRDFIILSEKNGTKIYDLCCGSGAITLEFINRGVPPKNITMCDISSWGKFWKSIGDETFSIDKFDWYCNQVPSDKSKVQSFLQELSKTSAEEDEEYKYLLLQAGAFGGKQICKDGPKWKNSAFRNYWKPTETSSRRSPVNPMMPSVNTLRKRVYAIAKYCVGINVIHGDITEIKDVLQTEDSVIYIDPPYKETTSYNDSFDLNQLLSDLFDITLSPIYVSEKESTSNESIQLNLKSVKKGGINGLRKTKNEEWLNVFR